MLVEICMLIFVIAPIFLGARGWVKNKKYPPLKGITYYKVMINSAVLYALAFNIIFFIQELFLVLGKKKIGLKSVLYHNNHTFEGEHPLALLMQGSGALAIFITGVLCLGIFRLIPYSKSVWKLFVLWMAFHGLIQSIPQVMLASVDTNTDVGEALTGYMQLSKPILITLSLVSIVILGLVSSWFSKPLVEFMSTNSEINNRKVKLRYIKFIAVGAAFVGGILIIPFRIYPMSQAITPFIVFAFSVPWIWLSASSSKAFSMNSNSLNDRIFWLPMVSLVLLLLFFQLILAPGVQF